MWAMYKKRKEKKKKKQEKEKRNKINKLSEKSKQVNALTSLTFFKKSYDYTVVLITKETWLKEEAKIYVIRNQKYVFLNFQEIKGLWSQQLPCQVWYAGFWFHIPQSSIYN